MTNNAAASDVAFFFQQVMRRDLMTVLSCDSKAREDRYSCLELFWVSFQCCVNGELWHGESSKRSVDQFLVEMVEGSTWHSERSW